MRVHVTICLVLLLTPICPAAVDYDIFMLSTGSAPKRVYRVDESSGAILASYPLPLTAATQRLAVDPADGTLLITSMQENTLIRMDPFSGAVLQTVPFAGAYVAAGNGRNLFAGSIGVTTKTLHRLAPDLSSANAGSFPLATTDNAYPIDMDFDSSGALLLSANRLRAFDPDTGAELPFRLRRDGAEPLIGFFAIRGGSGGDGSFFVRSWSDLDRYDASGTFQGRVATGFSLISGQWGGGVLAFGPNGHLYLCEFGQSLVELNPTTGARLHEFSLPVADFVFVPVPEPSTGCVVCAIALIARCRRRRTGCAARQRSQSQSVSDSFPVVVSAYRAPRGSGA
jgi:hypothetical protein